MNPTVLNPSLIDGGEHSELEKPANLLHEPDLTDPRVLELELRKAAQAINKQSPTVQQSSLMGGHPNPQFFYAQVAKVLLAGAAFVKSKTPVPTPTPIPTEGDKKDTEPKKK